DKRLDNARGIRHAYRITLPHDAPQEVSPVSFTLHLSPLTRQQLYHRLQQAYAQGALRLVRRIHARPAFAAAMSVQEVAQMWNRGDQTVRDDRNAFLVQGIASLAYTRPPGRPRKRTNTPRRQLAAWIQAGPPAAGSTSGCGRTPMLQDLM